MPHIDSYGLHVSTSSDEAVNLYREGVTLMLTTWPGAVAKFDAAVQSDPDFALAYAARARLHAIRSEPGKAAAQLAVAAEKAARNGSEREISHVAVLALAISGQSRKALQAALAHIERWPRDTIILSLPLGGFGLFAFSGMANHDQARVDLCERCASHFDNDDWWFLTYWGWALVENGDIARGRALVERAFELRRANANGVHALAHALHESGDDVEPLLADWLPEYPRSGALHGHIAWHAALAALDRSDAEEALQIYLAHVQPSVSEGAAINIVTDAASLLWRLELNGYAVSPERWGAIASYASQAFPKPGHAFVDSHMALIEAATGDHEALRRRIVIMDKMVAQSSLVAGSVVPAIARAAQYFAEAEYDACVRILEPCMPELVRIGGSGAQREVIEDTLRVARMRSDEVQRAHDLLDRRLDCRPSRRGRRDDRLA